MNKENMLKVADAIEKRQANGRYVGFNMNSYINSNGYAKDANGNTCGTTACVAGFASLLAGPISLLLRMTGEHWVAQEWLGLTDDDADKLFLDSQSVYNENHPLVPDALRYMAMTGRVGWKTAIKAAACAHGLTEIKDSVGDLDGRTKVRRKKS